MATAAARLASPRTLADRLCARDAALFRGRAAELRRLEALLSRRAAPRALVLGGARGVGKSALLRELRRRVAARGLDVQLVDAADPPEAESLRRPALLLLDHWALAGPELRKAAARRGAPRRVEIGPLAAGDAAALLEARGVEDADARAELIAWAEGSALALSIGARETDSWRRRRALRIALERRSGDTRPDPWLVAHAGVPSPGGQAIRDALRAFHDAEGLARSPLARGEGEEERAEHVRELLRRAIAGAFGTSPREQELRRTVEAAYLEARSSHEQTAEDLSLSRSAYFARLRRGVERIVPLSYA